MNQSSIKQKKVYEVTKHHQRQNTDVFDYSSTMRQNAQNGKQDNLFNDLQLPDQMPSTRQFLINNDKLNEVPRLKKIFYSTIQLPKNGRTSGLYQESDRNERPNTSSIENLNCLSKEEKKEMYCNSSESDGEDNFQHLNQHIIDEEDNTIQSVQQDSDEEQPSPRALAIIMKRSESMNQEVILRQERLENVRDIRRKSTIKKNMLSKQIVIIDEQHRDRIISQKLEDQIDGLNDKNINQVFSNNIQHNIMPQPQTFEDNNNSQEYESSISGTSSMESSSQLSDQTSEDKESQIENQKIKMHKSDNLPTKKSKDKKITFLDGQSEKSNCQSSIFKQMEQKAGNQKIKLNKINIRRNTTLQPKQINDLGESEKNRNRGKTVIKRDAFQNKIQGNIRKSIVNILSKNKDAQQFQQRKSVILKKQQTLNVVQSNVRIKKSVTQRKNFKITEWYQIFSDIVNKEQKMVPKYLYIPDLEEFLNKTDDDAIEWLDQVIDNFRQGINMNSSGVNHLNYSFKKQKLRQANKIDQDDEVEKETQKKRRGSAIQRQQSKSETNLNIISNWQQLQQKNTRGNIGVSLFLNDSKIQYAQMHNYINENQGKAKEQIEKRMDEIISKFTFHQMDWDSDEVPKMQRLDNDKCRLCKETGGQTNMQVFKSSDLVYYLVNKSYVHIKHEHQKHKHSGTGKLMFNIAQYQIVDDLIDQIQLEDERTIEISQLPINLECLDSNLISIYQIGNCLYYFKINQKENKDEFKLYQYNMQHEHVQSDCENNTNIQNYTLDANYILDLSSRIRMEPLAIMFFHKDLLLDNLIYLDEYNNFKDIEDQIMIIIVYKTTTFNNHDEAKLKQHTTQFHLSIRSLHNFEKEIKCVNLDNVKNLYQPHIVTKEYLQKQGSFIDLEYDLLIVGYEDSKSNQSITKIFSLEQNQNDQESLFDEISKQSQNTNQEYIIKQFNNQQNQNLKKIENIILLKYKEQNCNSGYFICSKNEDNKQYMKQQLNNFINQNVSKFIDKNYLKVDDKQQQQNQQNSVIIADYFHQKLLVLHNCFARGHSKLYKIYEFNLVTDRNRYVHYSIQDEQSFDQNYFKSPIEIIFQKYGLKNINTLMLSYEFKNLIRDQNHVYYIADPQKEPNKKQIIKKIHDQQLNFQELTGIFSQISHQMKQYTELLVQQHPHYSIKCFFSQENDFSNQIIYHHEKQQTEYMHLIRYNDGQETDHESQYLDELLPLQDKPVMFNSSKEITFNYHQFNTNNYEYKFIPQALIFKEDDRYQSPFVIIQIKQSKEIKNIWFTLYDMRLKEFTKSTLINLNEDEFSKIQSLNDIKLCQSSSIEHKEILKENKDYKIQFFQNYQLCIFFRDIMRFKFWEFEIEWVRYGQKEVTKSIKYESYQININQIGQKELIGQNLKVDQLIEFQLMPMLDQKFHINGTMILMTIKKEIEAKEQQKTTINLQNFTKNDFLNQNRLTDSGYKIYNRGFDDEYLLVEAQLSFSVQNQIKFFNQFEKETILNTQIRTILNMVPIDFLQMLESKHNPNDLLSFYDRFQCIEILQGACINDFFIQDPIQISGYLKEQRLGNFINRMFQNNEKDYSFNAYTSLIDQILSNQIIRSSLHSKERCQFFQKVGLLRKRNEISNDFYQITILERCMISNDDRKYVTADILTKYIIEEQEHSENYQSILMKMMLNSFEKSQLGDKSNAFLKFINDEVIPHDGDCNQQQQKFHIRKKLDNKFLPTFSDQELVIKDKNMSKMTQLNIDDLICKDIISHSSKKSNIESKFQIGFYIVDLRLHIFQKRLWKFRNQDEDQIKNNILEQVNYTEENLAYDVDFILSANTQEIENQQIIRHLIDYYFINTQKFFSLVLFMYLCGFVIPLIIQIFSDNCQVVFYCNSLILCTTILLLINEIIQMKAMGFGEYFTDCWNVNDFIIIILAIVYAILRLSNETFRKNFIPIDDFEFIDGHLETEIVIEMLQNLDNQTYVQNRWGDLINDNSSKDWKQNYNYEIYFMCIFNTVLILQSFIKFLFYLRIFKSFSKQVKLIGQCFFDVVPFMVFFFSFIILFSILFQVLGVEIFKDDYVDINFIPAYFIYAYRNAIGDVQAPVYNYWLNQSVSNNTYLPYVMISLIWLFWFLNQIINLIILLNFLIALISQAYDQIMSEQTLHSYSHKAQLNQECRLIEETFGYLRPIDFLVIQYNVDDEEQKYDQTWLGFVQTLKQYIKHQNDIIKDRLDHMDQKRTNVSANVNIVQKIEKIEKDGENTQKEIQVMKEQFNEQMEGIKTILQKMNSNIQLNSQKQ